MFARLILWIKFVLFTGHSPYYFNKVFSLWVSMDLDESINLGFCTIHPHGVVVGISCNREHYFISELDNANGIGVTMANLTPMRLIIGEPVKIYTQHNYCHSFSWAWLVIAAHNELLQQDFYAKRDKELVFNVVKLSQ